MALLRSYYGEHKILYILSSKKVNKSSALQVVRCNVLHDRITNTRTRGTAPFSVTARTGWRLITRPGHFCPCVCNCCWPWRPRWLPPPALRRLKGVIYGTDLADSCDRAPRGRPANLGLQPELGVRAQRRLGAGAGGSSGALPLGAPPLLMGCGSCLALADPQRFRVNGPHSLPPLSGRTCRRGPA